MGPLSPRIGVTVLVRYKTHTFWDSDVGPNTVDVEPETVTDWLHWFWKKNENRSEHITAYPLRLALTALVSKVALLTSCNTTMSVLSRRMVEIKFCACKVSLVGPLSS